MDTQQITAPSRATAGDRRPATPSGVIHVNTRHTNRYTVIGNHLAQHREMSLVAIGLAVHIQSLPAGAKIGIKFLADRFPESETRIAAALRELEGHGYLSRTRERTSGGRVITRTVSYNQPGGDVDRLTPKPEPRAERKRQREPMVPAMPAPATVRASVPEQRAAPPVAPLAKPQALDLAHHHAAVDLLADLRRHDPRLLLSEDDIRRLTPAVAAWLERDAHPDAVRRTLVADLPEPLKYPAGLLARRLAVLLPPALPAAPAREAVRRPDPLQNCDGCDRAFRAPEPGECCDCRSDLWEAA
ncbi:helix-turn-helix domain-containing protein [Streptomyces sp. NBC_00873]|uniref:helix-turn-helix domain-containing protein n=1 Tax=Streptomyces sp. NBC_00873 TaxID=2975852 RepID=UPI0038672465|nr:helix-turn-helix domain-containing protein [Streptomyces sp. NBC_00873]